ncbi:MAG: type II toxin-antitoxin system PemK/MazF family toxin [Propionibacteriales bacterium]|nr:type II toxin-antitoxin system PemK/MazF family toxin [Propionibacteriales bacterium]
MRAIHLVQVDKTRPAVILTRESARAEMTKVTVAPITSRIRGLRTEVPLGPANGLDADCVASCDNLVTVRRSQVGRLVGFLLDEQEPTLAQALVEAFDLAVEELPR